jgi:hypothetical protein
MNPAKHAKAIRLVFSIGTKKKLGANFFIDSERRKKSLEKFFLHIFYVSHRYLRNKDVCAWIDTRVTRSQSYIRLLNLCTRGVVKIYNAGVVNRSRRIESRLCEFSPSG